MVTQSSVLWASPGDSSRQEVTRQHPALSRGPITHPVPGRAGSSASHSLDF